MLDARALSPLALVLTLFGCGVETRSVLGDQCDLNSDCDAPLVCGLGRCRTECVASRDCALGLRCVLLQDPTQGVCQLDEEASCDADTDCPEALVCGEEDTGCTSVCATGDDCAAGQTCRDGLCDELGPALCVYDSSCAFPLVCDTRLQCGPECREDADCDRAAGRRCVELPACAVATGAAGPCACRQRCVEDADCAAGLACVPCAEGLDCEGSYCAREG